MTKLKSLFTEQGQSPWLDNLSRVYLRDGTQVLSGGHRRRAGGPAR